LKKSRLRDPGVREKPDKLTGKGELILRKKREPVRKQDVFLTG
jgi:hypothetical protein